MELAGERSNTQKLENGRLLLERANKVIYIYLYRVIDFLVFYLLYLHLTFYCSIVYCIGSYREIAIAIESEAGDSLT